jgi:hypothetical protein
VDARDLEGGRLSKLRGPENSHGAGGDVAIGGGEIRSWDGFLSFSDRKSPEWRAELGRSISRPAA